MFGFQGGETAWVATRKRDLVKDAPQKWPCLDAREKILIAPRLEFPRDRWRFMLALVLITLASEVAVVLSAWWRHDFDRQAPEMIKIRVGYELLYDFPLPTPMIMVLGTHFSRASDIVVPDFLTTTPRVTIAPYRDAFGNWCSRMVAPAGRVRLYGDGVVRDSACPT